MSNYDCYICILKFIPYQNQFCDTSFMIKNKQVNIKIKFNRENTNQQM